MRKPIRAIIVDDEPMARQLLQGLITENTPDVQLVDMCEDIPSAVKSINKLKPDLVFLDIEMPGHSGLELLNFFNSDEIDFHIIFTTAYHQYAIQAFKLSAVDYLLKPIEAYELKEAVDRYMGLEEKIFRKYDVLVSNFQNSNPKKLAVSTTSIIRYIDVDQIHYIQADGAYSRVVYGNNESIYSSKSLKYYDEIFSKHPHFMRTHKSYLVNLNHVHEYVRADGGSIKMKNGDSVGISTEKFSDFMKAMSDIKTT
ncbi:DNA-binding response regulator [Thermaurantimonas aggregans]|uniref:DNA-binding response regulator n=1 Tax=Thermaurantimonas aggregans TaxID=2173829 RepID=A0A401XHV2_9FLAO|nr:response regulator [Thermaurantimonas aggregans]MCX8149424.1 response regulator [Thermaurantimonas aggregans]GCD76589.1 DNA-binding response regulator [Thermaurantimonas aggregans]